MEVNGTGQEFNLCPTRHRAMQTNPLTEQKKAEGIIGKGGTCGKALAGYVIIIFIYDTSLPDMVIAQAS